MSDRFMLSRAECPEEVGVSSAEIREFLEDMKENELEFHSFMVIRNGKVACEIYREPFNPETPHALYSISKSVTATAVGIAVSEGYFTLDTRLVDVFPEYDSGEDKRLRQVTVRHLITMTAGKNPDVFEDKGKTDWIESYFKSGWYGEPGTFRYINENIFMLCAIIVRKTGMSVREFLAERLFEPLGIEMPFWETDRNGIEAGGWGLYLKLEDLGKLMLCYQQGGRINGKQIIPEEWALTASQIHADNSICIPLDCNRGYGFCFWRNGGDVDSFRADGMFSQFGIVFEKQDAVLVSLGGIADEQEARDCIWRHFPKAFIAPDKKAKKSEVENRESDYPVDVPSASLHSKREKELNEKTIELRKKLFLNLIGFPMSMLPLAVTYMTTDKAGNINDINFTFGENECTLSWTEGDEKNTVVCGMDGHLKYGKMVLGGIEYKVCCCAEWENDDVLRVNIRPLTTVSKRKLKFSFNGDRVCMRPSSTPPINEIAGTLLRSFCEVMPCRKITEPVTGFISRHTGFVSHILEPVHKGKLVGRKDIY